MLTSVLSVQMLLLSQDYGKHLLGVEDLLQKHALVEADISIQAERVKAVSSSANKYAVTSEGEQRPAASRRCPLHHTDGFSPQATSPATPR